MSADVKVVVLSPAAVKALVADAVAEALEGLEHRQRLALATTEELADELRCSESTVRRLRRGGMPTVMVADSPRYSVAEVIEWLKEARP